MSVIILQMLLTALSSEHRESAVRLLSFYGSASWAVKTRQKHITANFSVAEQVLVKWDE